jgi:hypothetical protein
MFKPFIGWWGLGSSIIGKKANHFTAISPCLRSFQKRVEDYMAFGIVLQNKTSFGVKSIFCKKDLFNLIRKYERLVTHVAIPKKFGGVD